MTSTSTELSAPKTTAILAGIVAAQATSHRELLATVTVGELLSALGARAFGLTLILFGLPNLLPVPGLPILTGLVLALLALQILLGRNTLWLPSRLAAAQISRPTLANLVSRALPLIERAERFCRPRFAIAAGPTARRVVGGTVLLLAILLVIVPIPWIGSLPQGLSICALGLGLAERDGIVVIAGFALSAIAGLCAAGITYAIYAGALLIF
ncbi:MAG: exopolysaccharide biosynthesis protein [Alphaproteobacteria bacterium]